MRGGSLRPCSRRWVARAHCHSCLGSGAYGRICRPQRHLRPFDGIPEPNLEGKTSQPRAPSRSRPAPPDKPNKPDKPNNPDRPSKPNKLMRPAFLPTKPDAPSILTSRIILTGRPRTSLIPLRQPRTSLTPLISRISPTSRTSLTGPTSLTGRISLTDRIIGAMGTTATETTMMVSTAPIGWGKGSRDHTDQDGSPGRGKGRRPS